MFIDIINNIKELDKKLEVILSDLPKSAYEKINNLIQIPLLTHLTEIKYIKIEREILELRAKIINSYIKGSTKERDNIINLINKYENFALVFFPNKDLLGIVEDKENYLYQILVAMAIENLKNDIRDDIIFIHEIKIMSSTYNIDFKKFLKKIISISSDKKEIYTVSMKDFFENVLYNKSMPVKLNRD